MLSAKQTCVLAWWAAKAGAVGESSKIGLRPDQQSGKYSRHFDIWSGAGTDSLDLYQLPLGRRLRFEAARTYTPLPIRVPHEALGEELLQCGDAQAELEIATRTKDLPKRYFEHQAVTSAPAGTLVHPFCIYIDAMPFTRSDSILGITVYFLLTERRHLVFVIRKSEVCSCGCRGWCSLAPVFALLAWSCRAMLCGVYPSARHDGKPWLDSDSGRAVFSGKALGFRAVGMFLKADWAELVHSFGFPSWNDSLAPCPMCFADKQQLYVFRGFGPTCMPYLGKTSDHYFASCNACEIKIMASAADIRRLRPKLEYEKRSGKVRGRALQQDFPDLGLLKGDRLTSTAAYPDIAQFDPEQGPRDTVWWRPAAETLTRVRNPLFEDTGISLGSLGIDWLHSMSLGVLQYALGPLVWFLLLASAWGVGGKSTNLHELGLARLREDPLALYKDEVRAGRNHTGSRSLP